MTSQAQHAAKPVTLAMTDAQQKALAKEAGRALDMLADESPGQFADLIDEAIQYAEKQERQHRASHTPRSLPIHTTATLIVARAFFGEYQPRGLAEVASMRNDIRDAHLARSLCKPEAYAKAAERLADFTALKNTYVEGADFKPGYGRDVGGLAALAIWDYARDVAGARV